jgi:hypothetical protein
METFVKLRPTARISYAGLTPGVDVNSMNVHQKNFALDVHVTGAKTKDGVSEVIEVNQNFEVDLGKIKAQKYSVMVILHPSIQQSTSGSITSTIVEPGESLDLSLKLKALRKIDLTSLSYFARLYVIG